MQKSQVLAPTRTKLFYSKRLFGSDQFRSLNISTIRSQ